MRPKVRRQPAMPTAEPAASSSSLPVASAANDYLDSRYESTSSSTPSATSSDSGRVASGGSTRRDSADSALAGPSSSPDGAKVADLEPPEATAGAPLASGPSESGFAISWHKLSYVLQSKWYKPASQRKPILEQLSGSFRSGELSAVLGPSGAGKSSLIECLLGKHQRGLSGSTRVEFGRKCARKELKIVVIPQADHLLDKLTVMETFMFASKLKNAHKSHSEHLANVQRVIEQLSLGSCGQLRCGKLSGGQYKRVSIGQELLARPDVMVLDEPTSGLDSTTCYQTVRALRELIESSPYPLAVVATIHQPDVEVFELFHKAYVLAQGGRAIYEGPANGDIRAAIGRGLELVEARRRLWSEPELQPQPQPWDSGKPVESVDELEELRARLDGAPQGDNPARLVVSVAAGEFGLELSNALNELHKMSSSHLGQPEVSQLAPEVAKLSLEGQLPARFDYEAHAPRLRRTSLDPLLCPASSRRRDSFTVYLGHILHHAHRSWLTIVRDPMLCAVQLGLHIFVPLLISYAFRGERGDACPRLGPVDLVEEAYRRDGSSMLEELSQELRGAFENVGYMFFQIYVILFAAVCMTSLTYPLVMHVLLKEYRNGWYSLSAYFLGRTLADLPVPTCNVVLAMAISYHLTGQPWSPYGWRFASVSLLTVLATLVAQTQGLMFGALLMNAPQSAVFVAPASTAPLVVVSGFLVRIKNLPWALQVLSKLSYFTYLINGFIVSRYGFNRCACSEEDFRPLEEHAVPPQARALANVWLDTFREDYNWSSTAPAGWDYSPGPDLIQRLEQTIGRAKQFNLQLSNCSQVQPFTMVDYQLVDGDLILCFWALAGMLLFFRWLTYSVLWWKIRSCL